MTKHIIGQAIF